MITLTNRSGRMLVLNLPHAHYCEALGRCECTTHQAPRLGVRQAPIATETRPTCPSLTLAAGHSATGLPEAVLAAPDVERAVRAGRVTVAR